MVFCVFVTFSHCELQQGADWHLKYKPTLIDLLEPWWKKYLCSAIALQGFALNRGSVHGDLVT